MNQWATLRLLCPRLYKHGMVFECGLGWFDLICHLSVKIELIREVAEEDKISEGESEDDGMQMLCVQVKENMAHYFTCLVKMM